MRQIIAMGGGGFTMEPGDLSLDQYILKQTGKPKPKVCFIPTASGDSENYTLRYFEAFSRLECSPSYLSLFRLPTADLEGFILEQDLVYVGGGNTRSMLALWREWELASILKKAYGAGVVMAGISAGANCWFEQCTTDSVPGALRTWPCLGFIRGSFSPHYDGEPERRPALHRLLKDGQILAGYAADDGAALHFVEGQLLHAICSKPTAKAYQVAWGGEHVVEEALSMMNVNATSVSASS
ncbi:MAG: peptidase E [Anaerolineales bacterium]|nr:peptidase E [Anaerolineales bacterium]